MMTMMTRQPRVLIWSISTNIACTTACGLEQSLGTNGDDKTSGDGEPAPPFDIHAAAPEQIRDVHLPSPYWFQQGVLSPDGTLVAARRTELHGDRDVL